METNVSSTSMIVMECGSPWPLHIVEQRPDAASVTAIVQQPGEHATFLKQRAIKRVSTLLARGTALESAVLSCGAYSHEATWASRALLARAMLSTLAKGGPGRLVLAAAQGMSAQYRHALMALADTLRAMLGSNDVSVAVSFA